MDLLWAAKFAELESRSTKQCKACNSKLELIRTVVDSDTGSLIHMFECECGERTWED